jgi:hypothetical protein
METNTLKNKQDELEEVVESYSRVYKGVATTYFHGNYPGTWSMQSQRTLEWPNTTDGNKYTQNWYSNYDCGTSKQDGLEEVVESYSRGVQGGCHTLLSWQLSGNLVNAIAKDLGMAKHH